MVAVLLATTSLAVLGFGSGFMTFGNDFNLSTLKIFSIVAVVMFVVAWVPTLISVWVMMSGGDRPSLVYLALVGMIIGLVEIIAGLLIAYNGNISEELGYIPAFGIAGLVGGATLSGVWNRIDRPLSNQSQRPL